METKIDEEVKQLVTQRDRDDLDRSLEFWKSVKSVSVTTQAEYDSAIEVAKKLKKGKDILDARRKELVKPLNTKLDFINGEFNTVIRALENGEKQLKNTAGNWFLEEQRRVEEENRKRAAEAEEKRRREEEAARKEVEKAAAYAQQGRTEMADKAAARAETHISRAEDIVPVVEENQTKGKGAGFTVKFEASLTDLHAFLKNALEKSPHYLNHVTVDLKPFERMQKDFDGKLEIPGIEFKKGVGVSIRTR